MINRKEEGGFIIYEGYRPLACKVLVAWKLKIPINRDGWGGEWRCYCDAVPGQNHDNETGMVLEQGDKVDSGLAEFMFKSTIEYYCEQESHEFSKLDYAS